MTTRLGHPDPRRLGRAAWIAASAVVMGALACIAGGGARAGVDASAASSAASAETGPPESDGAGPALVDREKGVGARVDAAPTPVPAALLAGADAESGVAKSEAPDPTKRDVPLTASGGWNGSLVIDNGKTGIWTVRAIPVFEAYGTPEIVGLDDAGRCHVMVGYSGKWTPVVACHDRKWLGGLTHGDVDPRIPGAELYTGGQVGNLYLVRGYGDGLLDSRRIASFPGREIHTILCGDLDPSTEGAELLAFTRPGALYRVTPTGDHGGFESSLVTELPGRVRDAVVLPPDPVSAPIPDATVGPEILTASRNGKLEIMRFDDSGRLERRVVYRAPMGLGRLCLRPGHPDEPAVVYATHDDGRVLRLVRSGAEWPAEVIYNGPQGPRGVAAGRFDPDGRAETVAVFGYSGLVQLLTRHSGGWNVETIFEDRDKGHWLSAAELDGRNATMELIGSGYGGRIFLLSRPPGAGVSGRVPSTPSGR